MCVKLIGDRRTMRRSYFTKWLMMYVRVYCLCLICLDHLKLSQ